MNAKLRLRFRILSYWHAGTSQGSGPDLDAQVARTPGGLPYLPGRTVKGLLRAAMSAAEAAGAVPPGRTAEYFGTELPPVGSADGRSREGLLEARRFVTEAGTLRFESATIRDAAGRADSWEAFARSRPKEIAPLFDALSSTAIDATGVAAEHTLRTIEVAVPMELVAEVACDRPDGTRCRDDLREACLFVHGLGLARHRGLGRVVVEVEER